MSPKILALLVSAFLIFNIAGYSSFAGEDRQVINIKNAPAPLFDDPVWQGAADPTPIWNAAEKKWFVYYTQRRASLLSGKNVEYCHGSAIGIASSADGTSWKYEGICKGDGNLDKPIESKSTWWAPCVIFDKGVYHLYVTWVDGIYTDWSGKRFIKHFTSKDGRNFKYRSTLKLSSEHCIDPCVWKVGDRWFMLYKDEGNRSHSWMAESKDLFDWKVVGPKITDCSHEAPFVWNWNGEWFLIVDAWSRGLRIYKSDDGIDKWNYVSTILVDPGKRKKDNAKGGHPGVIVCGDNAYVFYFVHFNPPHPDYKNRRTILQIAQLELKDGKITCDRDKFYKP
jgi:hypothetical protein